MLKLSSNPFNNHLMLKQHKKCIPTVNSIVNGFNQQYVKYKTDTHRFYKVGNSYEILM